ncbi:diguanylate cyclase (GGDEF)-like protein/PAS domain S-box-containing protein [Kineosporia succinea]|uniref:Diguanylate cyclase (GGDEF)-like protein/PAS domain S-box-containing protein n=1 Tax=Kineosporia succinea TaxID=84632 RepID=A0ABT9NZH3_9ACTN|nr:diguanylate cyclase [Kineosporia succinea]MDP9825836.1 diguanylate cyclase (GGDEF)-like protein/PAS domain S-box-containing protein [Kineosporia succinea]
MDHPDEARRLTELHSLGILDSAPEPGFDDLAQLAADLTGSPVALVTLIDEQRQWFKAKVGTDLCAVGRDIAFCDHVVRGRAELEVSDLRIDPRFASNPFVTGPPHAVFYAGFPVLLETGSILGTICVIDLHERELTERQREQMRALARQVSTQLELRRRTIEQAREIELRTTAQRQLARSRSEYRLLTENSGDVIARWTVDGRVTYMSPSAGSVLGLDTERDLGTRLIDRVHPDDQPVLREAHAAVLRGGAELITLRMPASGGDWHWLECTLSPLHDPDKGELEIHCAAREVTERVTAAARIAQSEERFRSIFHGSPMGITLTDTTGRLISANPAMCRLLGVPHDELIGRMRSDFVHPADSAMHPSAMRDLMKRPGTSVEVVVRFRRHDGVLAWASAWLSWIHDGDPEPHLLAHVFDITDRRAAEQALADSEANLAAINRVTRRILSGEPARTAIVTALVDIAGASLATVLEKNDADEFVITGCSDAQRVGEAYAAASTPATAGVWRDKKSLFIEKVPGNALVNQKLARMINAQSILYQPIMSGDEIMALLSVSWETPVSDLDDRRLKAVELLADEAAFGLAHDALVRRYENLAGTDQLTGLPNRRSWDERLSVLVAASQRTAEPFVVAVADVDRFKVYNDTHGHLEGDVLLREVAQAVRAELRAVDTVARWGGEEFAIALPNCRESDARRALERVRRAMPRGQTISIGYCHWDLQASADSLMNRADAALYEAKRSGRDRVVAAADLPPA